MPLDLLRWCYSKYKNTVAFHSHQAEVRRYNNYGKIQNFLDIQSLQLRRLTTDSLQGVQIHFRGTSDLKNPF